MFQERSDELLDQTNLDSGTMVVVRKTQSRTNNRHQFTVGKQPDIGWVPEETRHYHGLFVDTKLVNNLCSFIFFALQILKNEAPQEVKSDEKLLIFGWFYPLWKSRRIFCTTKTRRNIFYHPDTRLKLLVGLLVFFLC